MKNQLMACIALVLAGPAACAEGSVKIGDTCPPGIHQTHITGNVVLQCVNGSFVQTSTIGDTRVSISYSLFEGVNPLERGEVATQDGRPGAMSAKSMSIQPDRMESKKSFLAVFTPVLRKDGKIDLDVLLDRSDSTSSNGAARLKTTVVVEQGVQTPVTFGDHTLNLVVTAL